MVFGGRNRARTCDIGRVKAALSQLSYSPEGRMYLWDLGGLVNECRRIRMWKCGSGAALAGRGAGARSLEAEGGGGEEEQCEEADDEAAGEGEACGQYQAAD